MIDRVKLYRPGICLIHLGRILLFIYAVFILAVSILGAILFPEYARIHAAEYTPNDSWSAEQVQTALNQLGWSETIPAYVDLGRNVLLLVVSIGLGLLLLLHRPPGLFTFYLAFVFFSLGAGQALFTPTTQVFPILQVYNNFIGGAAWQFFFIMFYLFPNGKPVPGWSRWLVLVWLVFIVVQSVINNQIIQSLNSLFFPMVLLALGSQVYRYFRQSNSVERQQTRWVIAVIILLLLYIGLVASWSFSPPTGEDLRLSLIFAFCNLLLFNFLIALIPLVITLAIFRYRLWDIDLIIRRTVLYGILTLLLGLVYFIMVIFLGQAFQAATGQESPLTIVISTLVIAALFNPLRRYIQKVIDRRFFRERYNAINALDHFSRNLSSQVDLPAIERELVNVVSETIQPECLSLWIRKIQK